MLAGPSVTIFYYISVVYSLFQVSHTYVTNLLNLLKYLVWFPFFYLDLGSFIYQALSDAIGSTTLKYFYFKSGLLRYNLHAIVVVQSLSNSLMGCSTPGFPVLHQLLEFAQTHVHWVNDAISVTPFSSCSQSFPVSGSFAMSWFFASGGKITGALASVLPVIIHWINFL